MLFDSSLRFFNPETPKVYNCDFLAVSINPADVTSPIPLTVPS
jgi:hypothetical protein